MKIDWLILLAAICFPFKAIDAAEARFEVIDAAGKPVADAVIALFDGKSPTSTSDAMTKIVQKNKQFNPKVTVIQTGTNIQFPNEDSVRHHVYSFSPAKKFELKLYSGVPTNPLKFDQPGLVTLGCNIHDSMLGYIYIVDTPYFAKTDAEGQALVSAGDGQYTIQVWISGKAKPAFEQKQKIEGTMKIKVSIAGE